MRNDDKQRKERERERQQTERLEEVQETKRDDAGDRERRRRGVDKGRRWRLSRKLKLSNDYRKGGRSRGKDLLRIGRGRQVD